MWSEGLEVLRRYVTLVAANVSTRLKRIKVETKLEVRQVYTGSFILSLFLHHLLFDHRRNSLCKTINFLTIDLFFFHYSSETFEREYT